MFKLKVDDKVVQYSHVHGVIGSVSSIEAGISSPVEEGQWIGLWCNDTLVCRAQVRSVSNTGDLYTIQANNALLLHKALGKALSWRHATVGAIAKDIADISDNVVEEAYIPSVQLRRFSCGKDHTVSQVLHVLMDALRGYGIQGAWFVNAENKICIINSDEYVGTHIVIDTRDIIEESATVLSTMPVALHYKDSVEIAGGSTRVCALIEYEWWVGRGAPVVRVSGRPIKKQVQNGSEATETANNTQVYKGEAIVLKKSYLLEENKELVAEVLKQSTKFDAEVRAILTGDYIARIYAAEKKRFTGADRFPSFSEAWVRGILGGVAGGIAGGITGGTIGVLTYIGVFATSIGLVIPITIGALGVGAVAVLAGDPNTTVGRAQIYQGAFDDVNSKLQSELDAFMALLVAHGYISKEYQDAELTDVNIFTIWCNFFKFNHWFLEDFFCLGYLGLRIQDAWRRGKVHNGVIEDSSKHRTLEDAIKFGIAGYKGIDMSAVQRDAGVWDGTSKYVSDARYSVLESYMRDDDSAYVSEVYITL